MDRRFAARVFAVVGLVALSRTLVSLAAEETPKPGIITTVAGTGQPGYSGDSGPAIQAQVHNPLGLAFDASGNLYIGDLFNARVRKVSPDGTITTVAGTGTPGFSGDGGQATEAQLNSPGFLAVDGAGNLYISEQNNHRVRKVTPDGIITTCAGSGPVDPTSHPNPQEGPRNGGFSGDNGPATEARLNGPRALAVDAAGNLYIADRFNHRVRKVSPEGVMTTVVGTGVDHATGEGGLAIKAGTDPGFLAIDAAGDLIIAEPGADRVRKVTSDGIIRTVAGSGSPGFSGDGGKAVGARLTTPFGLAVDSAGNLFIGDRDNYRVRKVSAEGIITTVAGSGKKPYAGDGALGTETGLRGPTGLAIDAAGNLLIADHDAFHEADQLPPNHRVMKVIAAAAPGLLAGRPFRQ